MHTPTDDASVRQRATLLLTDVVDSTELAESLGDERAAALWAHHDAVARELLVYHRALRDLDPRSRTPGPRR